MLACVLLSGGHPSQHLGWGLEGLFRVLREVLSLDFFAKGEGKAWGPDSWVWLVECMGRIPMCGCRGL